MTSSPWLPSPWQNRSEGFFTEWFWCENERNWGLCQAVRCTLVQLGAAGGGTALWVWHFRARNVSAAFPALLGANFHQTHARGPSSFLFLLSPPYVVIYYFESFLIRT